MKPNIILIGMPGAGKSTVGVLLAKELGMEFVDTDILIQSQKGKTLQEILHCDGYLALREVEGQVLLNFDGANTVIATGGSAVYSAVGMQHLLSNGCSIYLNVPLAELKQRIHNYSTRGIACPNEQTIEELYLERSNLYKRYASYIVDCKQLKPEQVITQINIAIDRTK